MAPGYRAPSEEVVALYTDGLVEGRHEPIDRGIARLSKYLLDGDLSKLTMAPAQIADELVASTPDDDVAIVLVRTADPD